MPATAVGAELSAVIRAGDVTIELSSATSDQVATIAHALTSRRRDLGAARGARVLRTQSTNLRKSFDGLVNEIRHTLGHDPLGGHVFVFLNRRKNQVKLIVWTRGGFTIVPSGSSAGPSRSPRG